MRIIFGMVRTTRAPVVYRGQSSMFKAPRLTFCVSALLLWRYARIFSVRSGEACAVASRHWARTSSRWTTGYLGTRGRPSTPVDGDVQHWSPGCPGQLHPWASLIEQSHHSSWHWLLHLIHNLILSFSISIWFLYNFTPAQHEEIAKADCFACACFMTLRIILANKVILLIYVNLTDISTSIKNIIALAL